MRGLDVDKVSDWLADHVPGAVAPFSFELIAGGRSNLTFKVTGADGRSVVLRRPPLGHVLATAHDMAREHRVIAAVAPTGVPVPPALALCTDETVNSAPFYVMGYVEGLVLDAPEKADLLSPLGRRRCGAQVVDVLARLHAVDVDAVGLGDFSRRDGYLDRQLKRWSRQWESSKTRELAAIEEVERRLRTDPPAQQGTVIVHGDYRLGNMLVSPAGEIRAVLDWELCTLGDPLADVGWLLVYWSDPGEQRRQNDPTGSGGFGTRAALIEGYAKATGRDVGRINYYAAFAYWRLAVISEGVYSRYLHGVMADDGVDIAAIGEGTVELAEAALDASTKMVQ